MSEAREFRADCGQNSCWRKSLGQGSCIRLSESVICEILALFVPPIALVLVLDSPFLAEIERLKHRLPKPGSFAEVNKPITRTITSTSTIQEPSKTLPILRNFS
jgi:hypothetical protein